VGAPRADVEAAWRCDATAPGDGDGDGRRRHRRRALVVVVVVVVDAREDGGGIDARSMETAAIAAPSSDEGPAATQHSSFGLDVLIGKSINNSLETYYYYCTQHRRVSSPR